MASEVKTNKVSPVGTTLSVGDSGDTLALAVDAVTGLKVGSDAAGDILYYDGTDYTRREKPGTPAGEVLTFATSATAPTWVAPAAGGKILHIEQTVKTDTTSTTAVTGSPADITGMTVTMPASVATSRYLVFWNLQIGLIANWRAYLTLARVVGGVEVTPLLGDAASSRIRVSSAQISPNADGSGANAIQYLDSPATTSAVTYKIKWSVMTAGTIYLNRTYSDGDAAAYTRSTSSITVMEIGV